jgi:hypothetical protein
MATTTNYGWTTPDDTALVKDGAAAIRTLGSSVDTTTKNLNPETTLGDISYRSSTANVKTRLPLGTAGQVLKVNSGATAPEWATDASGMTNPMTTTGDTIYSSSGSTPARLGIGSAGQVLTVASGIPSWSTPSTGAMALIQRSTFSDVANTGTTFDGVFTSTYKSYEIVIENFWSGTFSDDLHFQFRYAGPTTESTGYIGNQLAMIATSTTTTNNATNDLSQLILARATGQDSFRSSGKYTVQRVGDGNRVPHIFGTHISDNESFITNGMNYNLRNFTGFLLKSSSANISGTVAVYGLV